MSNTCKIPWNKITNNYNFIIIVSILSVLISSSSGLQCYNCIYERIITQTNASITGKNYTNGNIRCKDFESLEFSSHPLPPLQSCETESDAMNFEETEKLKEAAQFTYPVTPAEFRLSCIKLGVEKVAEGFDLKLVIRGCYAKKLPPPPPSDDLDYFVDTDVDENETSPSTTTTTTTTTPPPLPPLTCNLRDDIPTGSLWAEIRAGNLQGFNNTPIEVNAPILTGCLCDTGDGCNAVGRPSGCGLQKMVFWVLVLIMFS